MCEGNGFTGGTGNGFSGGTDAMVAWNRLRKAGVSVK